jgi:hypothetical protein
LLEQKLLYERGNFLKELQFAQAKKDAYVMKKLQRKLAKEEEMLRQKYLQEEEEKIKLKQLYSKYFSSPFFQKTLTRKQKKKVNNTNDSSFVPPEQYALSKMYLQNSMSSIRNALEYQFKAAPGTWVRVNKGKWRYQCDTKENATTAVKINTNSSVAKKGEIINTTNSSEENTVESSIAITCEDTSANNLTSSSTPIVEIQVEAQAQSEETVAVIHKAEALVNPIEMTQVIDISQENIPSPQKRQLNLSPLKRKSPTRKVSKSPIKKPQTSNNLDISPKKIQHLLHNEGKWNTFNQEIDAEVAVAEHPVRRQQDVEVEDLEEYIQ